MQESQLKIYEEIQNILNQDLHDKKTRALTTMAYAVLSGYMPSIEFYFRSAIEYGATKKDFLNVISCIIRDKSLLTSMMEFFRILDENFKKKDKKW